jgi:hypothetical protein
LRSSDFAGWSGTTGRAYKIANVEADYLNAGLHAAIILDRFFLQMAKDDFAEIQPQIEAIPQS